MKTLKEAMAEVLEGMASFSVYDITFKLRSLVQAGQVELDTPLESFPGFHTKINRVDHKEVKSIFESYFISDFEVSSRNGFRVFSRKATIQKSTNQTPSADQEKAKIEKYVKNFKNRNGIIPTARQIQSALKRGRGPGYKSVPRAQIRFVINNILS